MASMSGVWGIDIGQCALKALKLRAAGDKVEAVAFDIIEHPKILSQPDADRDELIKAALEKFASRNDWQGDQFVIGIPGQQTFARFCKLPPADPKKIPDLVQYEAGQQIPFDMNDVIWDYQVFANKDSPDVEVGIFAIRKDLIRKHIEAFANVGISPAAVQTVPSALYNFCRYDLKELGEGGAVVIVDVGAQNTDLIIAEQSSSWTRNIPLGGNSFTEALIKSFKLSFAKAESLKRTAAGSKYARQIFQAMRPVFADLVAEVQRSLGFYSSTHRDVELKKVVALGNAFRLPGLQKYLENNLTIGDGVMLLEKFNSLVPSATLNAPQFAENVLSFGAAYGLALQGLGLATISASLLPPELARIAVWKKKRLWFVGAAAGLGLAAALPWTRSVLDSSALAAAPEARTETNRIVQKAKSFRDQYSQVKTNSGQEEESISQKMQTLRTGKLVVPHILALVNEAMPDIDPQLARVHTAEELKAAIKANPALVRTKRKQMIIESLDVRYYPNLDSATPSAAPSGNSEFTSAPGRSGGSIRNVGGGGFDEENLVSNDGGGNPEDTTNAGFYVELSGRLLFGQTEADANRFFTEGYYPNLLKLGQADKLGFYIPKEDAKAVDKENLRTPFIAKYYEQQGSLLDTGAETEEQPAKVKAQPAQVTEAQLAEAKKFQDPVTEEDMRKDWRFKIGFKVKLGEKPAEAKKDEENKGG